MPAEGVGERERGRGGGGEGEEERRQREGGRLGKIHESLRAGEE